MARRSKTEARREPCGGGEIAAEHQSEPYQRDGEGRPQRDQGPKRRPPLGHRIELVGDLRLEREPRGLEPARGGAERLLPVGMRALVENARLAHSRGNRIEYVEGGYKRLATRGQPGGDRSLLGTREETAATRPPRHPYPAGGPLDLPIERGRHALARAAHRSFPRPEPGAPAHHIEHTVAIVARGGGARLTAQLHHARG